MWARASLAICLFSLVLGCGSDRHQGRVFGTFSVGSLPLLLTLIAFGGRVRTSRVGLPKLMCRWKQVGDLEAGLADRHLRELYLATCWLMLEGGRLYRCREGAVRSLG